MTAIQAPEHYLEAFDDLKRRSDAQPQWLHSLRQQGFARFSETGFPTTHDEDWRFTNVAAISRTEFESAPRTHISPTDLDAFRTGDFRCQLTFVNGRFAPGLS